jgi:electron transport complex protein RnfC
MFPGGIHPEEGVNGKSVTGVLPITILPPPSRVIIPMQQHIGVPCKCVVAPGDYVKIGQIIGEAGGFVSAPVHASVSGKVVAVEPRQMANGLTVQTVIIENDFKEDWVPLTPAANPGSLSAKELAEISRNAGIVGLGGATFPTAVKLSPPPDKKLDTLVINGAECEPYLSADHRLMLEKADLIADGIALVKKALGLNAVIMGIESNKMDAVSVMQEKLAKIENATVRALPIHYPQGGEKQLIYTLTRRAVPYGGLPADVGVVVFNVGTLAAISRAVREGRPVVERVATVGGRVNKPGNFLVRIGTPVEALVNAAGGFTDGVRKVIYGGPMMGQSIRDESIPVTKGCSGLLALGQEAVEPEESNCIRCGRCSRACPMLLMPMLMDQYARAKDVEAAEKARVMNCIECGCCSFVCPAKRYLVQSFRESKKAVGAKRAKEAAAKKGGA